MQTSPSLNASSPKEAVQNLCHSVEKALDQNRALFSEITRFTQNESLRLAQLNLEHANHAFARFDDRRNLAGLFGAQQEWVRDMMQEYANQSLHYAEMFRSLAEGVRHRAQDAISNLASEGEVVATEARKTGKAVANQAQRAAE
jgi:uncharacterized membrane-anchored protein YhcB (DUF1043 family)